MFAWYQQLIAESLGKNYKGILPIISTMHKDNHSLMQFYLDGPKKNFFTFFYVFSKKSEKLNNNSILSSHKYLKNKTIDKKFAGFEIQIEVKNKEELKSIMQKVRSLKFTTSCKRNINDK